jgi:tripartite-type tricarboxylate transporter receptor subunit TctC
LPDVPTLAELGVGGFEELPYYGFFAPAGTPKAAIDQFSQALAKVIAVPEVKERLTQLGLAVEFMSSQQLANRERDYAKSWAEIIRKSGFQPQ